MSDDDEKNYKVGYGKPPKAHQFQKGQSGCPDGGHKQRKAKEAASKAVAETPQQMLFDWFNGKQKVKINGKVVWMTHLEMALAQLKQDAFVIRDPKARKIFFDIAQRNGWLKAPPEKAKRSVLVVYPIMEEKAWEKATEGELLPKDPLHGIPGGEGMLDNPKQGRRGASSD